jgi:hypothetical protein
METHSVENLVQWEGRSNLSWVFNGKQQKNLAGSWQTKLRWYV